MRLRNKKIGEIAEAGYFASSDGHIILQDVNTEVVIAKYGSLAELNAKWKDVPEESEDLKDFWFITNHCEVSHKLSPKDDWPEEDKKWVEGFKECGNYFETEEEAKKAVRKLKAWERLKDKGFRFTLTPGVGSLDITPGKFQIEINAEMPAKWFCCDAVQEDLDLLFSGEDD